MRKSQITLLLLAGLVVTLLGLVVARLALSPTHPQFGAISTATIYEGRTRFDDWMGETKSKLFGVPENGEAHRFVSLGGAPLEVGRTGSNAAFVYLNHPKLDSHPQWELALGPRASLRDVTPQDLPGRFYGMNDPAGAAVFGRDWQGHAVRVPPGRVVFVRAITNRSVSYAFQWSREDRGRGRSSRVEVLSVQIGQPDRPAHGR